MGFQQGLSGLNVSSRNLEVIGNNIANANTVGFKGNGVIFQDTLSQMLTSAGAPAGTRGGTNPIQIGLGVSVGGTTTNFNQGSAQVTGRATNLMISNWVDVVRNALPLAAPYTNVWTDTLAVETTKFYRVIQK